MHSWLDRLLRGGRVLSFALGLLLASCGGDDADVNNGPWNSLAERPCPEDSFLTYDNFGGPFMYDWCNGCHSADLPAMERQDAPLGINFDTLQDIRRQAARIWARSGDQNDTMPPIGGPHADERALLGEWLACGAPGNAP